VGVFWQWGKIVFLGWGWVGGLDVIDNTKMSAIKGKTLIIVFGTKRLRRFLSNLGAMRSISFSNCRVCRDGRFVSLWPSKKNSPHYVTVMVGATFAAHYLVRDRTFHQVADAPRLIRGGLSCSPGVQFTGWPQTFARSCDLRYKSNGFCPEAALFCVAPTQDHYRHGRLTTRWRVGKCLVHWAKPRQSLGHGLGRVCKEPMRPGDLAFSFPAETFSPISYPDRSVVDQ